MKKAWICWKTYDDVDEPPIILFEEPGRWNTYTKILEIVYAVIEDGAP